MKKKLYEITKYYLCLFYKCLNGQCPEYLGNRLVRISDMSTRTSTEDGKTFLVTAAKLWNFLPINIRSSTSINAFERNYCNFIKEGYAGLDSSPIS